MNNKIILASKSGVRKQILESNNIKLFDYEYRISYYELLKYTQTYDMKGGGNTLSTLNILKKKSISLKNIVDILLSRNSHYILYFLN